MRCLPGKSMPCFPYVLISIAAGRRTPGSPSWVNRARVLQAICFRLSGHAGAFTAGQLLGMASAAYSACWVLGPAMPSAGRPLLSWKAFRAAAVRSGFGAAFRSVARTDLPTKCGTGLPCAVAAGRRTSLSATGRTLRSVFRTDRLPVPIPTENVGSRNERNGSTWERGEFPMRFFMMRRAGGTSSALAPGKTDRESSRINPLEILYL